MLWAMKRIAPLLLLAALLAASEAHAASYEEGLQLIRNNEWAKAMAEFKPLAEEGHAQSQFSYALFFHLGRGVKKNLKTAYEWYKKAALQKHPPAMNNLGMMYLNGEYVAQHRDVAFKLFEMAAAEHAQAEDNLGQCYDNGWGVAKDAEQAIAHYIKAGDAGYILGYHHVAELYEQGRGVPRDIDKAVEWYIKAAEKKFQRSIDKLTELNRLPPELAQ